HGRAHAAGHAWLAPRGQPLAGRRRPRSPRPAGRGSRRHERRGVWQVEDVAGEPSRPGPGRVMTWLPVVLYCALIFALSSIPSQRMPAGQLWQYDKLAHGAVYGVLGLLLYRAIRAGQRRPRPWLAGLLAVLGAGIYGATDELHQSFVPGRFASNLDLLADIVGAALFVTVRVFVENRRKSDSRS